MIRPRESFQTTATAVNKQQTGSSNRTACFFTIDSPRANRILANHKSSRNIAASRLDYVIIIFLQALR